MTQYSLVNTREPPPSFKTGTPLIKGIPQVCGCRDSVMGMHFHALCAAICRNPSSRSSSGGPLPGSMSPHTAPRRAVDGVPTLAGVLGIAVVVDGGPAFSADVRPEVPTDQ